MEHADLRSQSSSYVDDDELSRQTVEDALPKDRMRFMSNKIKDNTCKTFVDLLKGTNISKGDSNWVSWEGYFGSIVDTLELKHWLYQGVPIPLTMQDLLVDFADNNMRFLESFLPVFQQLLSLFDCSVALLAVVLVVASNNY